MAYTKTTLTTAVQQALDSVGSLRWDVAAGGEADRVISMVFDREWKRILNVNRYYRMRKVTTTTNASGRIAISALSDTTPDAQKRFYRVLSVVKDNVEYEKSSYDKHVLSEAFDFFGRVWYREGTDLFFLPKAPSASFDITVNYIPTRTTQMTGPSVTVDFPEDYEDLLRYESAAWLLLKGGAETQAALELKTFAREIRDEMLQDIARESTTPDSVDFPDHPSEWAG